MTLWMGFKATERLQGDNLLRTTKSLGVPSIYLSELGRMKS